MTSLRPKIVFYDANGDREGETRGRKRKYFTEKERKDAIRIQVRDAHRRVAAAKLAAKNNKIIESSKELAEIRAKMQRIEEILKL